MSGTEVGAIRASDWPSVRAIYAAGIDSRNATFGTDTPEWEVFGDGTLAN